MTGQNQSFSNGAALLTDTAAHRANLDPRDVPHLLEWHSWQCVALADACQDVRVRNLLRQLAADLAIEVTWLRQQWKRHDASELKRNRACSGTQADVKKQGSGA
jgi:hypothetical protein